MVSKSRLGRFTSYYLFCFTVIFWSYSSSPSLMSISSSHDTVNVLDISELPSFAYHYSPFPLAVYTLSLPSYYDLP
jgi:hypothetical protein